jgi:hypothetical protein
MSSLKSLGPLGVSPASGYGHVVGTGARYYGEGTLNPKFYSWNAFFQIYPSKASGNSITSIKVGPKGSFIYNFDGDVNGLDQELAVAGDPSYIYIECVVSDAKITSASIKAYSQRKPLFEPENELSEQNMVRHFLGMVKKTKPFYKFGRNLVYPVIQSSYSVPIAMPSCINGFRGVLITTA